MTRVFANVSVAAALLLCAGGCSTTRYLIQQGTGQLRMLRGRTRIDKLLKRSDLPPERRTKLTAVLEARRFAHNQLGLTQTGAYTLFYDTGGRPVAYNISAAPKDNLRPHTWRFPIVGRVPYLGFFAKADAEAKEHELRTADLDTYLRPVSAYSSLGWFHDPVYSPMLRSDVGRLVEVVIHEMTHTTIFLRGEVAFNESLAVFVGQVGSLQFLARVFGRTSPSIDATRARFKRQRRFARLVTQLYRTLKQVYQQPIERSEKIRLRQQVFSAAKERYRRLFGEDAARRSSFVTRPLNNAVVLSHGRYLQGVGFHRKVFDALGGSLRRMIALYKRAQHFDDPLAFVARRCGLQRPLPQRM